jgi:anti-anti-sigma factor
MAEAEATSDDPRIELQLAVAERGAADASLDAAAFLVGRAEELRLEAARDLERAALHHRQAVAEELRSRVDDLTGALRRHNGFRAIQLEIDRARHGDGRLVVGFVDVDGLKLVNDVQGHPAGDLLIQQVVLALRSSLRTYDVLVRFGGDEFVFSMSGCDRKAAADRFDLVKLRLAKAVPGASISVGFARLDDDDGVQQLISRADDDLRRLRGTTRRVHPVVLPSWPGSGQLKLNVVSADERAVVHLEGDFDAASAPQLALVLARLLGERHTEIILDLAGIELMDTAGATFIARAIQLVARHDGRLVLRSPRPLVERVLAMVRAEWVIALPA